MSVRGRECAQGFIWRPVQQHRLLVPPAQAAPQIRPGPEVRQSQPALEVRAALGDQEAQEAPQRRQGPAVQRDLEHQCHPSAQADLLFLRSNRQARDKQTAQSTSRYACEPLIPNWSPRKAKPIPDACQHGN